ncbi:MAG TPA: metalloregulator ArsR/SmtB family transcription factor [Chloroflexota bacterium]|jgi:DNA-binding transcriptional ArsR family regulator
MRELDNSRRVARAARRVRQDGSASAQERLHLVQTVVCEPARLKIVQALSEGPLSVGDLATVIRSARPATSQHLRVLRQMGVVEGQRQGTTVNYQLCPDWQARYLQLVLRLVETASA